MRLLALNSITVTLCYNGRPKHLLNRLRFIQNTAVRIVTLSKRFDHVTPIMFKLYWLALNDRIHFKILLLVYKCLTGLAPTYLSELLRYSNSLHDYFVLVLRIF